MNDFLWSILGFIILGALAVFFLGGDHSTQNTYDNARLEQDYVENEYYQNVVR